MHSEPAIENRATTGGRRRKRGNGSVEGPVFVDNSGRRSKLLKRFGLLVGVLCLGYAVVLGLAFLGIGTSVTPSSLLPFRGGQAGPAGNGPAGYRQQGGVGDRIGRPGDIPSVPPSGTPTASASATAAN
ncbi:hypothetical protein [Streptomyces griseorubiginosus]|uniref:hypothetical protein n=1 Tax=Streptomyces griseorubiginosus TaxID=67304 RepID=UPI001AD67499|nr:hypothetical protein [Streptomyces griseorubiginosus]MBO4255335.1 hypothetical protein [Streptomyces griseorubiginosus]